MRGLLAVALVIGLAEVTAAQDLGAGRPTVPLVANPSLADAAIAVADPFQPVIYYNPGLLRSLGHDFAAFLLAHEEGHIHHGHRLPAPGLLSKTEIHAVLRGYEREADCYAARRLAPDHREAVLAAAAYFRRLGTKRGDDVHPTGRERAETIMACYHSVNPIGSTVGGSR